MFVTFTASVALSVVASSTRFGDSAHAMGLISDRGGRARHPVHLPADGERYTLVVTATVLPPYRGDASVTVEGPACPEVSVRASGPVVDLGLRRLPVFRDNVFYGLEPGDRLAMWVVIGKPPSDPVCGHLRSAGSTRLDHRGKTFWFCSEACREAYLADPDRPPVEGAFEGAYQIVFRDLGSRREVLRIPLILEAGGDGGHGHDH